MLNARTDVGVLWENFLVSERMKFLHYNAYYGNRFFWRSKQQQEIDYIEERDGQLFAYQFKWNEKRNAFFSKTFRDAYPETEYKTIHKENWEEFLVPSQGK